MPRPLRIQFPGAWYHVFNRGARRQAVFADDRDRSAFVQRLSELEARFDAEIHAYCLMGNHYHLVIHTPAGNLDQVMHWLLFAYTKRFNARHGFDGPLYRDRYKSILIDSDSYLAAVSRYVHRNPLEAGLVEKLVDYRWSSYRDYLGCRNPRPWVHKQATMAIVGGDVARYQGFVEVGAADHQLTEFYGSTRVPPVLGNEDFAVASTKRAAEWSTSRTA